MEFKRNFRRAGCAWVLALACGSSVFAAETATFGKTAAAGQKTTFAQSMNIEMATKASMNGQVMQQMQQAVKQLRQGTATVDAVGPDGRPSKMTFVFGPECGGQMTAAGAPPQSMPSPLAGKTVTVTKKNNDPKDLQFTGGEGLDEASMVEITEMFRQDHTMMPTKALAVGESWDIDPADLANMVPPGSNAKAKATGKLLGVKTVEGRQVADIEMTITLKGGDGMTLDSTLSGKGTVDVASSQPLDIVITGPVTARGQQQGEQGPVDVAVDGKMTMSIKATLAGGAANPGPVVPGPVVPGPEVVTDGPAVNLNGTYADPKITFTFDKNAGTIKMGDKEFPVTATVAGPKITGEFRVGDKSYPFTATLAGDTLTLITGTTTYNLKRAGGAPVSNNPLEQ